MELETRVALVEKDVGAIKEALSEVNQLKESVILLNQSVQILNKVVWGVLACLGSTIVAMVFTEWMGGM